MLVDEHDRERSTAECRAFARALRERGVTGEDRILLSAGNSGDFVLTLLACMHLGASIGLIDPRASEDQVADMVSQAGVCRAVFDESGREALGSADSGIPLADLAAEAERLGPDGAGGAAIDLDAWAGRADGLLVWTSGTSGAPKGIVRSGASVLANGDRSAARMGYRDSDLLLPLLPFTHQYGLSLVLLWWRTGCTLIVRPGNRVDRAVETISAHGVTVVDAVPAAYETMLRLLDNRGGDSAVRSVRMWCVGGEPLRDELRERFARRMRLPLLDGYGSSEAGNIALAAPDNPIHCGRALDGVTAEVVADDGAVLPAGEVGEVVVRTPDLMTGTLQPGGQVRAVQRPVWRTQDLGYLDEYGNLRVLGRKSAVHRFGHTLYPDAIAGKAAACGAPVEVVPVEDARSGTQLVLFVEDPSQRPVAHWRAAINECLADHERPNRTVVLSTFPLRSNGKVDLRRLREMAGAAVDRAGAAAVEPAGPIPFPERVPRLEELANLLRTRRAELLEVLTEVSNHKTAAGEIDAAVQALDGAAAEVRRFRPGPVEQLAVLMPSNIPLYGYILYLVIPSLYARRIVFRPSRRIEDQTRKLHELLGGAHGLPITLNNGDQREFLEGDGAESEVVVFTGAYDNAERIHRGLRPDQLFCYFGQGLNPFIAGRSADVAKAVDGLLRVRMLNSGQDCFGPDVVFVDSAISAQFCNLLCRRVGKLRYGSYDDPSADYGRMFYLDAFDDALDYLRRHREHLAAGGEVHFEYDHVSPTVLIRPADSRIKPPELFAPIFNVVPFTSREWLHTAVEHPYFEERAMAATVFGDMPDTVELLRRRHSVSVDETLIEAEDGNAPFGGTGIRANYAAIGKKRHARPLLLSKAIAEFLPRGGRRADA